MNQLDILRRRIETRLPSVELAVDEPVGKGGSWMLDLSLGDRSLNVEWRPYRGFGISRGGAGVYGEGPDEIVS